MNDERGIALVTTLVMILLLSAIGAALVLVTSADVTIAANAGASIEAFYAADGAFELATAELRASPDFTGVLTDQITSAFVDGGAGGSRVLSDGSTLDLSEVVNQANCARSTGCSAADLDALAQDRPWGSRNPRWRLFSHGPFRVPASADASHIPVYVVTLVADDPGETDDDPDRDGVATAAGVNSGAGILLVRAEAFGRRGAHRVVEGTVVRHDLVARARWEASDPATRGPAPGGFPVLQVIAWRSVR